MDTCTECLGIGLHFSDCSHYDESVEDTAEAIAASRRSVRAGMRTWVVERQWLVEAETATKAIDLATGAHRHIRVYEGTEHRPWKDDVDPSPESMGYSDDERLADQRGQLTNPVKTRDRYHPNTTVELRTQEGGYIPLIAYVCADCGSVVVDKAVHDRSHEDQK